MRLREEVRANRWAREQVKPPTGAPVGAGPLVSVIVVAWNSAEVLGRCLEQLLVQDHANYEIVLVDDGSQDRTVEVAERALPSRKLRIVRSPANRGCPHARNLGLGVAGGELIAFIDADGYADASWLGRVVAPLEADEAVGAVASTVFFAFNPLVLNGAGGTVNRQGWAADICMNQPYERSEIAAEVLYPMGCGMAVRRSAVERVGGFDDRMRNYYDDVDYGMRLWRAGYRVVVAPDAWIDHDFAPDSSNSARKQLLCERHRMRVVLKHACPRSLIRWAVHEARGLRRARSARRAVKVRAFAWNAVHLPSVAASRWHLRRAPRVPDRLITRSWGDDFPAGVPPILTPRPERAGNRVDMANPASEGQLVYGWFPVEHADGRSYRWATAQASVVIRLGGPARRLRLDYSHVPVDIGGVDVVIRRLDSPDPPTPVWSTHLPWRYTSRSIENRPLALPVGDYEVVLIACRDWLEPPLETRSLGFALSSISLDESYEIVPGGLDMASPDVEEQLMSGWFEAEHSPDRSYRWADRHAAALVCLPESVTGASVRYRMPPAPTGGVDISVRPVNSQRVAWSTRIAWRDGQWREKKLCLDLAAGEYVVAFDAEDTWSNAGREDATLPPEKRSLGIALASLSFGESA